MLYTQLLDKTYHVYTNAKGYFYIDAVTPSDDYRMWINPAGMFHRYTRENLSISPGHQEFSILLKPIPQGSLSGTLVDSAGNAVRGFGIKVRSAEKDLWVANVITNRYGGFQIDRVPLGKLEFSSTFGPALRITGYELERDEASLVLVADHGFNVVNGRVLDQDNRPLAGASVVIEWEHRFDGLHSMVSRQIATDVTGHFSIENIGFGMHNLMISDANGLAYTETINITNYNTDLTVVLPQKP